MLGVMHIPPQFAETRIDVLQDTIQQAPLATFVVYCDQLVVNHFPMIIQPGGEHGVLQGHIPRNHELADLLAAGVNAAAVFHGPQSYVTPNWYPSKREHGKVVPTWNYIVVHAHGVACVVQDPDWVLAQINQLTDQQEHAQPSPWQVADAPSEYTQQLVQALVGIEMPIDRLEGKWKVSQNRSAQDQLGVAQGLRSVGASSSLGPQG